MLIVDSQVHIWKENSPDRPWTPGLEPQLQEPMSISGLIDQMSTAGVDRVVIVPPNWEGMRNDYATEAYDSHPDRFRFMGRLNLDRLDAPAQLASWMDLRGNLGMRQSFLSKHERDQFGSGSYDWLWEGAERYGIPVMVHAAGLGPSVERIARRHPSLKLILDHMGLSSGIVRAGRLEEAAANTIALAQFPNVFVKLSSAPLRSREKYPFRDMHDYIHRIIDAFGPKRSFWGTDLSHMLQVCGYKAGVTLFTEELGLSPSDLEWIMGRALCECLNWPVAT